MQVWEKKMFLLWAGTRNLEQLLIIMVSGLMVWRGLCASRYLLCPTVSSSFLLTKPFSNLPAHIQIGICCNCHIPLISLFSPFLSKAFLFHFFNIFLPPPPLFFIY